VQQGSVGLADGRVLGYREFGDPAGFPVVNCHGGLVCGLDVAPFADAAAELGVRLISPDRPGIGLSDPRPDRSTADWADDIAALLDRLGLDGVGMLGWSMGGQYALACAERLGARVTRTVVIAGAVPLDDDEAFAQLNSMDRRLTRLSERHPLVARLLFATIGGIAGHAPGVWTRLSARGAVPDEAAVLESLPAPGIAAAAAEALEHAGGMVEEYRAWVRPWGFSPEDVRGPVTIWQGDEDDLVPPAWGRELSERIPDARLILLGGEGHFLGYRHQAEILRDLLT